MALRARTNSARRCCRIREAGDCSFRDDIRRNSSRSLAAVNHPGSRPSQIGSHVQHNVNAIVHRPHPDNSSIVVPITTRPSFV